MKATFDRLRIRVFLSAFFVLIAVVSSGCDRERENVHRAFYEWRSRIAYSPADLAALDSLKIDRLYVRFFDVQWSDERNEPYPESIADFASQLPTHARIIPTIYIENGVMRQITEDAILANLAANIRKKVDEMARKAGIRSFDEVQIDCDWTASSRVAYFELLQRIREEFAGKTLSATIRLHQIRHRVETGVPPVDRGMLMAYNVGEVVSIEETNSIFTKAEVEKYIENLDEYPLPLDAALPLFSWGVRFHFDRFAALIDNVTAEDLQGRSEFKRVGENLWRASRETELRGETISAGDIIRVEEPHRDEVLTIAERISADIDEPTLTIALYRFDPEILSRRQPEDFHELYEVFE